MAKKPTQKSSKIKNNNIKKEELNKNLNKETIIIDKLDDEIKINIDDLKNDTAEFDDAINKQEKQESVKAILVDEEMKNQQQDQKQEPSDLEKLTEENLALKKELLQLNTLINNLKEENNKLQAGMQQNQQQLIDKLKEKQNEAKEQLEARLAQLEQDKQSEIDQRRDSIYVDVVSQFLSPFLLFEKTITAPIQNEAVKNYVQGYNMICNMFKDTFNNLGIEQIVVNPGDEFNHNFMEAFDTESNPNFKPNQVTKVVDKGFVYKGKVIKYTTVVVNK